jgi:hypothetical protein
MTPDTKLAPGDVVQLSPDDCRNRMLAGCFMVVTEPKSFGAVGYVQGTGQNEQPGGQAYYRAQFTEMELVGYAEWIVA